MKQSALIYTAIVIVTTALTVKYQIKINPSNLKDYLDTLLNVSGMVFTIMGIWIAFLYPNALLKLVNPTKIETADFSDSLQETKRLEAIVASILKSASVVTAIMLINLIRLATSEHFSGLASSQYIHSAALSITITLSYVQLESVLHVIFSNVSFINDLHNKREEREADGDI